MRFALVALVLVACSKPADVPADVPSAPPAPVQPAAPTACWQASDCPADHACEGQGCDSPGECRGPNRGCTEDVATFCSCEGQTVEGSSTCPGTRYRTRGECPADAGVPDAGLPDAGLPDAAPPGKPTGKTPVKGADRLFACAGEGDCEIYWRTVGSCFPADPVAINKKEQALAGKRFPRKRGPACGMGGPQYDRQRRAHAYRWATTCKLGRCEVVDRGNPPAGMP